MTSRLTTIDDILEVTTKPIILDGDTGGLPEHFVFNVKTLERLGVSAVIIEDKIGPRRIRSSAPMWSRCRTIPGTSQRRSAPARRPR